MACFSIIAKKVDGRSENKPLPTTAENTINKIEQKPNNTNSVMQNKPQNDPLENSKEKINTEQKKIRKQIDEKTENEKEIQFEEKP